MSMTETQQHPSVASADEEPTISIPSLSEANPRNSLLISISGSSGQNVSAPSALRKTKDDIRYYFRPLPKEDIRIYFRPISKLMSDRPRAPRTRTASSSGKPKVRSRRVSPSGRASPSPGPEVPPKAKERTSGQKNREIFLSKQREAKSRGEPGRVNQTGSTVLPGFDPILATHSTVLPTTPLSPRITEVVDSSLMPSPLRNKSDIAAESAPEYDDRADRQIQQAQPSQAATELQQSTNEEYPQTSLPQKLSSIYGSLPPFPVRIQRNNSQPTPNSPRLVRHRRQDTPYSPNDVGKESALNSPELPDLESATCDPLGRSSSYASSDVLPTPVALEEWASEQRRIARGQPATIQRGASSAEDNATNNDKDKTLKKAKSTETRLFRSRKGKAEKKDKEKSGMKEKLEYSQSVYQSQASRSLAPETQNSGPTWDVAPLAPSSERTRPSFTTMGSEMDNSRISDSMSDKIVVTDPQLTRTQTDQSSSMAMATKAKKPNKFLRMLEAYSKNMEGLQMVQ